MALYFLDKIDMIHYKPCLLFMRRISEAVDTSVATDEIDTNDETDMQLDTESLTIPDGAEVYEINDPLLLWSRQ